MVVRWGSDTWQTHPPIWVGLQRVIDKPTHKKCTKSGGGVYGRHYSRGVTMHESFYGHLQFCFVASFVLSVPGLEEGVIFSGTALGWTTGTLIWMPGVLANVPSLMLNSAIPTDAACFVGKVCSPLFVILGGYFRGG